MACMAGSVLRLAVDGKNKKLEWRCRTIKEIQRENSSRWKIDGMNRWRGRGVAGGASQLSTIT
jgi:hypothetical protein